MGRQIKFRVWEAHNKKFSENPFGFRLNKNWELSIPNDSFDGEVWEFVYQQFTGLLDKNGREIYEGDILQYDSHDPQFSKTLVRWTKDDEDNHPGFVVHDSYSQYGKPEIIGNIFENPELLT